MAVEQNNTDLRTVVENLVSHPAFRRIVSDAVQQSTSGQNVNASTNVLPSPDSSRATFSSPQHELQSLFRTGGRGRGGGTVASFVPILGSIVLLSVFFQLFYCLCFFNCSIGFNCFIVCDILCLSCFVHVCGQKSKYLFWQSLVTRGFCTSVHRRSIFDLIHQQMQLVMENCPSLCNLSSQYRKPTITG